MGFNLQQNAAEEVSEQHEINVTPFIDVMLVLLIIFMVAAPLATVSVPVNLPSSATKNPVREEKPLYLTVQKDLTLTLGEKQVVERENLSAALQQLGHKPEQALFLRADRQLEYGELMQVMNELGKGGYHKIALVGLEQVEASAANTVAAQ